MNSAEERGKQLGFLIASLEISEEQNNIRIIDSIRQRVIRRDGRFSPVMALTDPNYYSCIDRLAENRAIEASKVGHDVTIFTFEAEIKSSKPLKNCPPTFTGLFSVHRTKLLTFLNKPFM